MAPTYPSATCGRRRGELVTRRTRSCTARTSRGPSSRMPISGGPTFVGPTSAGPRFSARICGGPICANAYLAGAVTQPALPRPGSRTALLRVPRGWLRVRSTSARTHRNSSTARPFSAGSPSAERRWWRSGSQPSSKDRIGSATRTRRDRRRGLHQSQRVAPGPGGGPFRIFCILGLLAELRHLLPVSCRSASANAAYAVFDTHGGSMGHILSGWRYRVDLVERAGALRGMLVDFALSDRFDREFTAVIARQFPGGPVTDEAMFTMTVDHFALQHRLPSGTTVVQEFVADHPELPAAERDMLLAWQDVVEGLFEITGKDRDAVL